MQETEKRTGLTLEAALRLKPTIDDRYSRKSVVKRMVVVKVDNDDFSPNPDALVDIKTKLIGDQTLLSVKYGSWHGVLLCNFRPRRFAELWRTDERAVDQSLMTSRRGNTGPGSPRRGGSESSEVATTVCPARFAVATPVVQE